MREATQDGDISFVIIYTELRLTQSRVKPNGQKNEMSHTDILLSVSTLGGKAVIQQLHLKYQFVIL